MLGGLLALYYMTVALLGLGESTAVPLEKRGTPTGVERARVAGRILVIDPAARSVDVLLRLAPSGTLVGPAPGRLAEAVRLQVRSEDRATVSYPFGESQAPYPIGASLSLDADATWFPLDRPQSTLRIALRQGGGGEPVPVDLEMENSATEWRASGTARASGGSTAVTLEFGRDPLAIALAVFYLLAIPMIAVIAVTVVLAGAVKGALPPRPQNWMAGMLVFLPATRNAMPGAPPVGTMIDIVIFFPALGALAMALIGTTALVAWRERPPPRSRRAG